MVSMDANNDARETFDHDDARQSKDGGKCSGVARTNDKHWDV